MKFYLYPEQKTASVTTSATKLTTTMTTTKNYTRSISNSKEICDASITLDKSGSERWGEWIITTQYLQKMGGGNWIDCYSRDEFFSVEDAIEHGRDKVAWLTNRASTLSN